jgi:hypothetical protein
MIPNKFPKLPKKLFNQEWTVSIDQKGISEDGEPLTAATVSDKKFWFNGKRKQVINAEKQIIRLEGTLIALGDLFPDQDAISTGIATKGEKAYKIYRCQRPLNPDGSVYATVLELM